MIHVEVDDVHDLACEVVDRAAVVEVAGDPAALDKLDVEFVDGVED